MRIEEELFDALERALSESELNEIHASIDQEMVRHRFPDESVRERTRRASTRNLSEFRFSNIRCPATACVVRPIVAATS